MKLSKKVTREMMLTIVNSRREHWGLVPLYESVNQLDDTNYACTLRAVRQLEPIIIRLIGGSKMEKPDLSIIGSKNRDKRKND